MRTQLKIEIVWKRAALAARISGISKNPTELCRHSVRPIAAKLRWICTHARCRNSLDAIPMKRANR